MENRLFRCSRELRVEDCCHGNGRWHDVTLPPFSRKRASIQYASPLSPKHPCYLVQLKSMAPHSQVTIGVAGEGIGSKAVPGKWNRSAGYSSEGTCLSHHADDRRSLTPPLAAGDTLAVMVTYFGKTWTTLVILRNEAPIATRYLFEDDHLELLPTISLENGPIKIAVLMPRNVVILPQYSEREAMHWMRGEAIQLEERHSVFWMERDRFAPSQCTIQSPTPLSREFQHFSVIVQEVGDNGEGPEVGLSSCSAMNPRPQCSLLNDYNKWIPNSDNPARVGQRIGWGVHYDPHRRHDTLFDAHAQQLVLCYVTIDVTIVYVAMLLQPEGGWYPLVCLTPLSRRVVIDAESHRRVVISKHLDRLYAELLPEAMANLQADRRIADISMKCMRSSPDLHVSYERTHVTITLPQSCSGVHLIQFLKPLTCSQSYFSVEITVSGRRSIVCVGVADDTIGLATLPGLSHNTLGYYSLEGRLLQDGQCLGPAMGQKFGEGDMVGVEYRPHAHSDHVTVLFTKNHCPVGLRSVRASEAKPIYPTIALSGNGDPVQVKVVFQNRIGSAPVYPVGRVENWCLPSVARTEGSTVCIDPTHQTTVILQAPYPFRSGYNHFEIEIDEDKTGNEHVVPIIALLPASLADISTASDETVDSDQGNEKTDLTTLQQSLFMFSCSSSVSKNRVKPGDLIGLGVHHEPDDTLESSAHAPRHVIAYVTLNRSVEMTRRMREPPGGLHACIIMPENVSKVTLNPGAMMIDPHPFTPEKLAKLQAYMDTEHYHTLNCTHCEVTINYTLDDCDVTNKREVANCDVKQVKQHENGDKNKKITPVPKPRKTTSVKSEVGSSSLQHKSKTGNNHKNSNKLIPVVPPRTRTNESQKTANNGAPQNAIKLKPGANVKSEKEGKRKTSKTEPPIEEGITCTNITKRFPLFCMDDLFKESQVQILLRFFENGIKSIGIENTLCEEKSENTVEKHESRAFSGDLVYSHQSDSGLKNAQNAVDLKRQQNVTYRYHLNKDYTGNDDIGGTSTESLPNVIYPTQDNGELNTPDLFADLKESDLDKSLHGLPVSLNNNKDELHIYLEHSQKLDPQILKLNLSEEGVISSDEEVVHMSKRERLRRARLLEAGGGGERKLTERERLYETQTKQTPTQRPGQQSRTCVLL